MNKVLILGAGMVAKPITHYLTDNNFQVTLASRTKDKAEKILNGRPNGKAISWTINQTAVLDNLIESHDIVVSLLPYVHHTLVAKKCIAHKKNMVTTSYVSDDMRDLDEKAKEAGIIILNELGVDPGYDHMTAMEIIDQVHDQGGSVNEFYSFCGALCAPESANNPFRYKFSWSPKGVIMASNNDAQFLKNGKIVKIDTKNLFKNPLVIDFPEVEQMHVYPNRNSLPYIDIYGIPEAKTMMRGTFRYKNWCEALHLLKALKLVNNTPLDLSKKTYAEVVAEINRFKTNSLETEIKAKFNIDDNHSGFKAIKWLGLLDNEKVHLKEGSSFDLTSDLMINKMMMTSSDRDMVIMQHIFNVTYKNEKKETIVSRMLDYGNKDYTSIARTVALPAAIGVKMVLNGEIKDKGVLIPIKKSIYKPILKELKTLGITMLELKKAIT